MVQVIPPKTSLGTQFGQALQQGLGTGFEQGIQRGMLQGALKGLEEIPAGASPFQIAKQMLSATAGLPEQGRVLQALMPYIQKAREGELAGGIGGQSPANLIPGSPTEALPIPLPKPQEGMGEGFENIGMGVGEIPSTYTPEQYQQVQQQYLQSGLDPSAAVNQMKQQDQIARERYVDIEKAAAKQAEFTDYLEKEHPGWSSSDRAVAERISLQPDIRKVQNNKLKENFVRKKVELYQSAKDNLMKGSERRNYDTSEHNRQVKNLSEYAKTMVNAGQRDEAEKMLAENGWGPTEIQSILNPLPEKVIAGFKGMPPVRGVLEHVKVLPDDPRYDQETAKAFSNRQEDLNKYKTFVGKNFQTGSYDPVNAVKPGTSLLELRDEAMQKGVTFQEFESMVNDLVRNGEIKLDQYQQKEHPLLSEHPARSFGIGEILWRMNPFYIPRK